MIHFLSLSTIFRKNPVILVKAVSCSFHLNIRWSSLCKVMTALPTVELDPPTISMTFGVNDSPLAGRDGTHVCS